MHPCTRYNHVHDGRSPYLEITCLYPSLSSISTEWETSDSANIIIRDVHDFTVDNPYFPWYFCAVYCLMVFAMPSLVKEKISTGPFLPLWNLFLSVFSTIGFLRTAPTLLHICLGRDSPDGVATGLESLFVREASEAFGSGSCGVWVALFIYSKIPELIDTLFLILRRRPIIFLHWYHHITVLLFCFQSYRLESPSGLVFCVMNYGVHAVMYGYYFLTSIERRPAFFRPFYVTFLQLSQMFVGVSCCVYSLILYNRYTRENLPHHIHPNNLVAAFVMYASYFALFAKFAWDYWERLTLGSKIGTPKIKIQKSDGKKYSSPNSSTQNSRKKMKKQH